MSAQMATMISRSELRNLGQQDHATITEFEHLASYNWLDKKTPTMMVPGSPPLWSPPAVQKALKPDSGLVFIDQNAVKSPIFPLEPLFRALYVQHPFFDITKIDLVTDRNNLRKLLRFIKCNKSEPFQIRVEIVGGKTALFTRTEKRTSIKTRGFHGYGHNFEKAYTKKAANSSGHHRIASYHFCGLHILVRYEADGHIEESSRSKKCFKESENANSLSNLLETLQISEHNQSLNATSNIVIERRGEEVDNSCILEIKTRSIGKASKMNEIMPQLWISQTKNLVVAIHREGLFENVEVKDMSQGICEWEGRNQQALHSLGFLLKKIIAVVNAGTSNAAIIEYDGEDLLKVISSRPKCMLPHDLYTKWKPAEQQTIAENLSEKRIVPGKASDCARNERANISCRKLPKSLALLSVRRALVEIGNVQYELDVSQFPYFASLMDENANDPTINTPISHEPIPHFDVAVRGVLLGYGQCFQSMSMAAGSYHSLCNTYDFLGIDVCGGRTLDEIIKDLKVGQGNDGRSGRPNPEDAAFRLVYFMFQNKSHLEARGKNQIFNALVFVASRPQAFKRETRKILQSIYASQFTITAKQKQIFDEWDKII